MYKHKPYFFRLPHIIILFVVFSAVVMLLWNLILPDIFALPSINYWQAMGLLALSRILFGGLFGRAPAARMPHGERYTHLHQKWQAMSPAERDAFLASRFRHFHNRKAEAFTDHTDEPE